MLPTIYPTVYRAFSMTYKLVITLNNETYSNGSLPNALLRAYTTSNVQSRGASWSSLPDSVPKRADKAPGKETGTYKHQLNIVRFKLAPKVAITQVAGMYSTQVRNLYKMVSTRSCSPLSCII